MLRVTGISRREILAQIKERRVIEARFTLMLALRKRGLSTPTIGDMLNRDHSTVLSGLRRARDRYDSDPVFRAIVDEVMRDD